MILWLLACNVKNRCFAYQNQAFLNISQAFPAGSGPTDRTTYMFTYLAPQPQSPKIEELLEEYWKLMPEYQVSSSSCLLSKILSIALPIIVSHLYTFIGHHMELICSKN